MPIETPSAPQAENLQGSYDEEASASLRKKFEDDFASMSKGSFDAMRRGIAPEVSGFDYDFENHPTRMHGATEWSGYVDQLEGQLKDVSEVEAKLTSLDCYATKELGFAVAEFEQSFTLEGKKLGPFHWRGTMIARRAGNDWLMVHWHSSPAENLGFVH